MQDQGQFIQLRILYWHNSPPQKILQSARWCMKAVNYKEAEDLLTGIKNTAPAPVFDVLFQMTDTYLLERNRARVQHTFSSEKKIEMIA